MDSDQQDACMTLQVKSCGLEETFLNAGSNFIVTEDDIEYATNACESILNALKVLSNQQGDKNGK